MKTAKIPTNCAQKPKEVARVPFVKPASNKHIVKATKGEKKTYSDENNNENSSQNSYKDMLSQPASQMSHREKLQWLQKRRTDGLWVQCDDCDRWRYLPHVQDRHYLPDKWYCRLNPDISMAKCSVPEAPLKVHDEEDLIHSEYSMGSVVWAKMDGYPWWPAMIDDCPDTEQYYWIDGFSDIPIYYHVVFFDSQEVTRAWLSTNNLVSYHNNRNKTHQLVVQNKKFSSRLSLAVTQADEAEKLSLIDRLQQFSFITRYPGKINPPRKVDKELVMKFYKKFQKQFHIELNDEIFSSDSDEGDTLETIKNKKRTNNVANEVVSMPKKGKIVDEDLTQTTFDSIDGSNVEKKIYDSNSGTTQDNTGSVTTVGDIVDQDNMTQESLETTLELNSSMANQKDIVKTPAPTQDSFKRPDASPRSDDFDF